MYTFSSKLKIFSIVLIVLGAVFVSIGFMNSHKYQTEEQVKELLATEHGHGHGHGDAHATGAHGEGTHSDAHATGGHEDAHHGDEAHAEGGHEMSHEEHVLHQIHNRPWAAIYVGAFFFFMIALGALAFYAIQRAAQAGWSPVLFRVMEAITAYVFPGAVIVFLIALASHYIGHNNIFIWMDPDVVAHDKLIQGKQGFLNMNGFIIRGIVFIAGWSLYRYFSRKWSIAQDNASDISNFKKNFRVSAKSVSVKS